ncbi:Ribosome biogenesis protein UTP30 [Wickerhamiella sorbophila]|uniref:Ribosome biogenesis protein UTP30 n=1 Tax=Wickerhamiella sorbophila TaxID=45607 RepID=A0A2T0FKD8_9ASCO|nr:Ribosome biogenesis protein UTP30 [Wickerhamiella sorbophila]PRT55439.1 Ribosome biogenesis protein UTP30 [Wickerhamiella sorbophila]
MTRPLLALLDETERHPKLEGPIYLGIIFKKDPVANYQEHAMLIPLPHRTRRSDEEMICVVVKDPQHAWQTKFGENKLTATLFDEVTGVGKLRRRLKSKKAIESFGETFTKIFVQDKVAKPLSEVLGTSYFKRAKHLPIPIQLDEALDPRKVQYQVRQGTKCAQLVLKPSTFASVRVGHTKMDAEKTQQNIDAARKFVLKRYPDAKLHIKTPESMSLPL